MLYVNSTKSQKEKRGREVPALAVGLRQGIITEEGGQKKTATTGLKELKSAEYNRAGFFRPKRTSQKPALERRREKKI